MSNPILPPGFVAAPRHATYDMQTNAQRMKQLAIDGDGDWGWLDAWHWMISMRPTTADARLAAAELVIRAAKGEICGHNARCECDLCKTLAAFDATETAKETT